MQIPLPLRSNPGAYKYLGEPKLINGYAEIGGEDNKTVTALMPHKGMEAFGLEMGGPCRGGIYINEDDALYTVQGGQLYKTISDGSFTTVAAIGGEGAVRFSRNDAATELVVAVTSAAVFLLEAGSLLYLDYEFTPVDAVFLKGRFVYPLVSGKFWYSDINSTNVDGLSFATAEADPDGLVAAAALDDLYLIGTETTEVWAVTTNPDAPFAPIGGTYLRIGCAAKHTVQKFNNALAWVGHDNVAYMVRGYTETPFSSNEVSRLIAADPDKGNIVAWTYEIGENKFYVLKGSNWCREYNAKTGFWSDRVSGANDNWRAQHSFSAFGQTIFGDSLTGKLYSSQGFEEDGEELLWGFDTPVIHSSPDGLVFNSIYLDMQGGVGNNTTVDPKVMLSWSDDQGDNFSVERQLGLGAKGKPNTRLRSRRLGKCEESGRVFRVRISDPVQRSISSIDVQADRVPLS